MGQPVIKNKNIISKRRFRKFGLFALAFTAVLAVSVYYFLETATSAPVEVLNGDGSLDTTTQVNTWGPIVNTTGTSTWALDTTNKIAGTGSGRIQSPTGASVAYNAYVRHTFTTSNKAIQSATLDFAYRKQFNRVAPTTGNWNVTIEIWQAGGTSALQTITVDTGVANVAFKQFATQTITGLASNTNYEIRLKVQGRTGANTSAYTQTNFDEVKLNVTYDTTPPALSSATTVDDHTVNVVFNEAVDKTSAENIANYSISPSLAVTGAALQADNKTVQLTTAPQTKGTVYTVSANNVSDTSGNVMTSPSTATFTGMDTSPPVVSSAAAVTDSSVNVVFNEAVDKISAETVTNYSISPSLTITGAVLQADNKTVTLSTSVQTKGTSYTISANNISDVNGNIMTSASTANFAGIDTTPPQVVSATVVSDTTVNVVFNETVDPLTASSTANYSISPNLAVTGAVLQADNMTVQLTTAYQTKGTNYTITVNNVKDASGNIMTSPGTASFTGLDNSPPQVTSANATTDGSVNVVFNEAVDKATAETLTNYSINPVLTVTGAALQADNKTVILTTSTQTKGTNYTVSVNNVSDINGNAMTAAQTATFTGVDTTPPQVVSANAVNDSSVNVVFNETVDKASAETLANYSVSPSLVVSGAALQSDNKTVTLTVATQNKGTAYTVTVNNVKDTSGNAMTTPGSATFTGVDTTPPQLTSASALDDKTVNVVFNETVDKTTAETLANYSITPALTITAATLQSDNKTVTLTTTTQSKGTAYTIAANNVKDTSGNAMTVESTATFTGIDTTPPQVVSASAVSDTTINVVFNEAVDVTSAANITNYTISPALTISSVVLQPDNKTVAITAATQAKGTNYTVTVTNVSDISGNVMPLGTASFTGIDTTPPQLVSASAVNDTTVNVLFNEEVDKTTAETVANYTVSPALAVTGAALQADNKTVILTTVQQTKGTNYTVSANNVKDISGNAITTAQTAAFTGLDTTPPRVSSASAVTDNTVNVVFNETIDKTTAETAANYAISPALNITGAALQADNKTVKLTTATQTKGTSYTITANNIQDTSGNTMTTASTAAFVGIDTTPPQVTSAAAVTDNSVNVVFNETLDKVSAENVANYAISPALNVTGAVLQADNMTVKLTTATQTKGTNYTVTVNNVRDTSGNAMITAGTAGFTGLDTTPPQVVSAAAVTDTTFNVVFNEALDSVSAANTANYSISPALAITGAALQADNKTVTLTTTVQTKGTVYTVTVNNVKDTTGNTMVSPGIASFTGIDTTPPQVLSASVVTDNTVDVVFSEDVDPLTAANAANYGISPALAVNSAALQNSKTVRLTTATQTKGTNYTITVNNVKDNSGNAMAVAGTATFTGIDTTPPNVVSATAVTDTSVKVVFNEEIDSVSANNAANYSLNPALTVNSAVLQADGKTVILTTATQVKDTGYVVTSQNIKDTSGNNMLSGTATFTGIDTTAPQVVSAAAVTDTTINIVFNEPVDMVSATNTANYGISPALAVNGAVLQPDNKTVVLSTATQTKGTSYTVTVNNVKDTSGNVMATGTAAFTGIDTTAPSVVSAAATTDTVVNVVFSEALDKTSAENLANYSVSPALNVTAAALQADGKTVQLTTAYQTKGTNYTITVSSVKDTSGNAMASGTASFSGMDITPPQVVSASAPTDTSVNVVFNEPLDKVSAENTANYAISPALNITGAALQADGKTIRLTTDVQNNGITYTVTVSNIQDTAGNIMTTPGTTSFTGLDTTPPVIVSAGAVTDTTVDVVFNEPLDKTSAEAKANYSINPALTVSGAALQADGKTVRLTTSSQVKGTLYTITVNSVKDTTGNAITNGTATFTGIDTTPPQVVSAQAATDTTVNVVFNEALDPAAAASALNYSISPALAINSASLQADGKTVTLGTQTQVKGTAYTVTANNIKDTAGNTMSAPGSTTFTGVDTTAPQVNSAVATTDTTVNVVFNEDVDMITATNTANYSISPALSVSSAILQPDNRTVVLTTATQAKGTNYTVTVNNVTDISGNAIVSGTAAFTGIDTTPPQVLSATAVTDSTVNVVFNEAVDTATANNTLNYTISPALAVTGATLQADGKTVKLNTATQTKGTTYTITVNNVKDLSGNAMTTAGNANFTGIDTTPPQVVSVTSSSGTTVDVKYNEAIEKLSAENTANYSIAPALSISGAALQADGVTVRLTTSVQNYGTIYTVTVNNVKDTAGNAMTQPSSSTFTGTDNTPPVVQSAAAVTDTTVKVVFNEAVDKTSAENIANYSISPSLNVSGAALQADGKTVQLTTAYQTKGINYTVTVINVKDTAGNAMTTPGTASFTGLDNTPPQVVSASSITDNTVNVVFNEPLDAISANNIANYSISPALTVTGAALAADNKTVKLTTATQAKGVAYTVTVNNVKDAAGNAMTASGTASFTGIDTTPPQVTSATPLTDTTIKVVFSEAVDPTTATAKVNYSISPSLTVNNAVLQPDGATVVLTTDTQVKGAAYTLTVTNVTDTSGNAMLNGTAAFSGIDTTPPQVTGANAPTDTSVNVVFNEAVDKASAENTANYMISPTLAITGAALQADGKTVKLTTGAQQTGTSYSVTVSNVSDTAGNAMTAQSTVSFTGVDTTPPQISSVSAVTDSTIKVVYNEAVEKLSAENTANYAISPTLGITGAALQVDGKTVLLTTATQVKGTVYTLSLINVKDSYGNAITVSQTASFTGIDTTAPLVASAAAVTDQTVNVVFNEPVEKISAETIANYSVTPALSITGAVLQADGKTVQLTTTTQAKGTSYTVTVSNVKDTSGNAMTSGTAVFTGIDTTPAQVSSASAVTDSSVNVVFNETVDKVSAETIANYSVTPALSITGAALQADGKTILLTTSTQGKGTNYTVTVNNVKDTSGNIMTVAGTASFTGIDTTPPQVASAVAVNDTTVNVVFNEAVNMFTATNTANYSISPALNVNNAVLLGDGKTVQLTTATQAKGVIYTVSVNNVTDTSGNAMVSAGTAAFTGLDTTPPQVVSATAPSDTTVNLVFNEALDKTSAETISNYSTSPTLTITGAALQADGKTVLLTTSVQANGTSYTVTANNIKDTTGNIMTTPGSASFTGVDTTPPKVVSANAQSDTTVNVVFNEALDKASAENTANYAISPALAINSAALQADGKTVVLTTAVQSVGLSYTITVNAVKDTSGNAMTTPGTAGFTGQDTTPPKVTSAVAVTDTTVKLIFNETVDSNTASNTLNYTLSPALAVNSAVLQPDGVTVVLTTDVQTKGVTYTVTVTNVQDINGNAVTVPESTTFVGIDTTPPKVQSAKAINDTTVDIAFNEAVDKISAETTGNYTISPALDVIAAVLQPDGLTVRLTTSRQTKDVIYTVAVNNVKDTAGNVMSSTGTVIFSGLDNTPPQVVSASAVTDKTVDVVFNELLDTTSAETATNYAISPSLNIIGAVLQADGKTVRLSTLTQTKGTNYTITVNNVKDTSGNAMTTPGNVTFTGIDTTPPQVASATAVTDTSVKLIYNEAVDKASAETVGNYSISPSLTLNSVTLQADGITVILSTSAQAKGTVYNISVSNVSDISGNTMITASSATFTGIDTTPPKVVSATAVTDKTVNVTFNEDLDKTSAEVAANYSISPALSVTGAALQADGRTVRLTTATQVSGTNYTVSAINVKDVSGNAMVVAGTATFVGIDTTPPQVLSAVPVTDTTVNITFNETLDQLSAENINNYSISPGLLINTATLQADKKTVQLSTAPQISGTNYTVTVSNVEDTSGNALTSPSAVNFVGLDTTPPQIYTVTAPADHMVNVIFSEVVTKATAENLANYSISPSLAITAAALQSDGKTLKLTTANQTSGLTYTLTIINVQDPAGNIISTANSATFIGRWALSQVPHGNYKTLSTASCATCHNTHSGSGVDAITNVNEYSLCIACHNGTSGPAVVNIPNTNEHLFDSKNSYCSGCHDPHKSTADATPHLLRDSYDSLTKTGNPGDYQLCFDCHQKTAKTGPEYVQSQYDIYQFNSKASNSGNGTYGLDSGHFIKSMTGAYLFGDGTPVPQGYQLRCTDCHDKHGSKNKMLLKEKVGDNPNAINLTDSSSKDLTVAEERSFCQGCHNGTTHLYNSADKRAILWNPQQNSGHTDSSQRCTDCHGGAGDATQRALHGAHAPTNGESIGGADCATCHKTISNASTDANNGTFHHVANNTTFNDTKYKSTQSCFQCHVDHDQTNPAVNAGNKRGSNLRQTFDPVTGAAVGTNTDFISSFNDPGYVNKGGLCLSCHQTQQNKGYDLTEQTQVVNQPSQYEASAHNYNVSTTFTKDNSTFNANCSKCHNDNITKENWSTPYEFGTHSSDYSSILSPFEDKAATNPLNEQFCYKCHSNLISTTNDAYGIVMTSASKNVYDAFNNLNGSKHLMSSSNGLSCVSCHGPHVVSKTRTATTSDISDPTNTLNPYTTAAGDMSLFCLKCHNATPPTAVNSASAFVPGSITFPSFNFTSTALGWNKTAYTSSGHYSKQINCDVCHDKHGTNYARLLNKGEDTSIADGLCLSCHNGTVPNAANVRPDLMAGTDSTYRHPTLYVSGKHSDTESYPMATQDRHANCADCHEPHSASAATAADGNASGKIANVLGVNPNYPAQNSAFAAPSSYTKVNTNKEYQLCFKCHTGFNGNFPAPPTGAMPETDLSKEFNPANPSFHNVGQYTGTARDFGGSFQTGSNLNGNSVLYCTSCHGADTGSSILTAASSPAHGSTNQYILKGQWNQSLNIGNSSPANNLCLKCHNMSVGNSKFTDGSRNLHTISMHINESCQACHSEVPHGGKRPSLITVMQSSPSSNKPEYQYDPAYDGVYGTKSQLYLFNWKSGGTFWSKADCGGCHL